MPAVVHKSPTHSLSPQLNSAGQSVKQLKDTLEELEGNVGEQNYHKYLEKMEVLLKEKEREVGKIRAAEKARVRPCTAYTLYITIDPFS